jgi:hypothetical protein
MLGPKMRELCDLIKPGVRMAKLSHQTFKPNKNEKTECFCALCRSPRVIRYSRRLMVRHYFQILTLGFVFTAATYSWFAWNGVAALPIIWIIFESTHKSLYRKDLKCPFCGFDPTWYKKDVKLARRKVEEFLKQNPESPVMHRGRQSKENSQSLRQ